MLWGLHTSWSTTTPETRGLSGADGRYFERVSEWFEFRNVQLRHNWYGTIVHSSWHKMYFKRSLERQSMNHVASLWNGFAITRKLLELASFKFWQECIIGDTSFEQFEPWRYTLSLKFFGYNFGSDDLWGKSFKRKTFIWKKFDEKHWTAQLLFMVLPVKIVPLTH